MNTARLTCLITAALIGIAAAGAGTIRHFLTPDDHWMVLSIFGALAFAGYNIALIITTITEEKP